MAKDTSHDLQHVADAVRRKQLAAEDIKLLREKIAALDEAGTEHRFVKAILRNLKVAGTQLRDIQARNPSDVFDEAAFEPRAERLDRVAELLGGALARGRAGLGGLVRRR